MDKKVVVHIHNRILLSYLKEHIWVSSNEVDETGANYTEWKIQILQKRGLVEGQSKKEANYIENFHELVIL